MLVHTLAPPVTMMAFGSFFFGGGGGSHFFFSRAAAGPPPLAWGQDSQSGRFGRISGLPDFIAKTQRCVSVKVAATRQVTRGVKWRSSSCFTWWGSLAVQTPSNVQSWMGTDPSIVELCISILVINPSIRLNIDFLPMQKPASLHGNPRCQFHPLTFALHLSTSVF